MDFNIAHFPLDQSAFAYYYYPVTKIVTNILHNRQVPDTLWSTKQIEIKYLAQGHKHAGRSGARTHNIDSVVITSPALFR